MKKRLVLMDFITDQTENVYPMIAGQARGSIGNAPRAGHRDGPGAGLDMRHIDIHPASRTTAGALSRVAGLFSARGVQHRVAVTVAPTEDAD